MLKMYYVTQTFTEVAELLQLLQWRERGKETKLSKYMCKTLDMPSAGFCATGAAWLYSLRQYMVYSFCQPGASSFFIYKR